NQYKLWCLLMATCFSFHLLIAQGIIPTTPQLFSSSSANNQSTRITAFGGINYTVATPSAPSSGTVYQFLGNPTGFSGGSIFSNSTAWFFHYALNVGGGNMYVPYAGQSPFPGCDYRMSFSADNDTTLKSGNFKILSMYLAIGTGNTSDVIIQGFRAGKMVAQGTISALSTNDALLTGPGGPGLSYNGSDAYSGIAISFGSNWSFLDGLKFTISSGNIPLKIDDLTFDDPDDIAPSTQASSIGFTNNTGVSSQINWTPGGGDSVAVFVAAGSSSATLPATHTFYNSNTTFGSGGQIASTGWYCIYKGKDGVASPSTSVYGLTPGTAYKAMAISYNGAFGWENYNTTAISNVNSFTTIAIPATQASNITVTPDYTDFRKAAINWTRGNGAKSAVFVKNNTPGQTILSAVSPPHNDNNSTQHTYTAFTDSVSVTANGRVGSSGWYCVFNGAGSGTGLPASVNMTRISVQPGQTLRVMVVEYNGTAGAETYNTTSASNNVIDYFNPNYPLPITDPATGITSSGATLNGNIDPRSANITNGTYVYSLSSSLATILGTITTLTPAATSILGSASATAVAGALTGLLPSTTYYYRLSARSNAGILTATNSTGGATNGIRSFTTAPVVSSVSATTADGSYKAGGVIVITVVFTSAVTVSGTPTLALNSGATASYASGSGSTTLSFNYTISGGETSADLDYTSTSALALSGGTIKDASTNDALLTLPTVGGASSLGGQKNIVIDTQTPTVSPVTIASNNATTTLAKVGDIVTLNFTSGETIVTPTVTIAGHAISATNSSANNWFVAYTMVSGDATGVISFSIPFNDIAGNTGATTTATTNSSSVVFDKTAPVLTPLTISSNNANTALAKTGDIVTLSFTADETINTPTVTLAGHTVTAVNTSANNWKADYTMVSGDANGVISINISFSDLAGNSGTAVTATTNSSTVTFDKTAPLLTAVAITSNGQNPVYAKAGDVVFVSFTSDKTITTPTVNIGGNAASVVNTGGNNWMGSLTLSTETEGNLPFTISFSDLAGNAGTTVSATTNSTAVTFDKTVPSITTVTIASNNTNPVFAATGDMVTISFTSTEPIQTPSVTLGGNGTAVTNTGGNNWTASRTMSNIEPEGVLAISISFRDLAGNAGAAVTATTNSSNVTYDKTHPVISSLTIASNNSNPQKAKTGDVVTVSLTASEPIKPPSVTIASHAATTVTNTGGNSWTASYTMTSSDANGPVFIEATVFDLSSNNSSTLISTTNSSVVTFDKTIPQLSAVSISSNNNSGLGSDVKAGDVVTLSISGSEIINPPVVTIAGHSVAVSGAAKVSWAISYTMVAGDAEGIIPFSISFSDVSGNQGTQVTATTNSSSVKHDKTVPLLSSVTIASNNAVTTRAKAGDVVTVVFVSSETLRAPFVRIHGQTVTATNTSGNTWSAPYTMTSGDANGTVTLSIGFSDVAGNAGVSVTTTTNNSSVVFDKTAPTLSPVTIASNGISTSRAKTGNTVTINFTSGETINIPVITIAGHTVTANNTSANNWTASYTMVSGDVAGNISFSISFSDLSGNAGTTVTTTTNSSSVTFDETAPSLTAVSILSDNANTAFARTGNTVTINFTAGETISTPVVTIAGHTANTGNTGANNWRASYTMVSGDASGNISFNISFSDLSGNAGTTVTATTDNSSVTFDKTAPVLTTVSISSDNTNTALARTGNTVTVSFTSDETISAPIATIAGHSATINNAGANNWKAVYTMVSADASGNIAFSISFADPAGNAGVTVTAATNSSNVVYDKTGPSLTTVSIVSNNADPVLVKPGDIVTLNFASAEAILVPSVTIAGNNATVTTSGSNNWIANYTMTGADAAGTIPFAIACTDLAGNVSITVTTTTNSSSVTFDKTAPSVNSIVRQLPSAAVINTTSVTYRVSFSEAVKGITASAFLLTTSGATTGTIASVSAATGTVIDVTVNGISGNGTVRLDFKTTGTGITDAAGNTPVSGFNAGETYTINQSILSFPAGSTQTLTLCVGNGTPTSLNNMLRVAGGDNGQTLTWTIITNPSNGTLNGFPATTTITGTPTTPTGLSYLATNGYTGTDAFTVQVSDGVVTATASVTVTVNALPIVTIAAAQGTILCGTGASLPVTASGGATYNWHNNGSLIQNATGAQLTVNTIGSYTAKAVDAAGCTGIEGNAIVITQLQKPTVVFNYTSYCIGKPISFIDQSVTTNSGQVSYLWNDGNTNTSTSVSPVFTYNQQAVYNVKLKITPTACPSLADSLTKAVSIDIPVAAIRMPTMNVAMNDQVQLQARTFGTAYQWLPSTGISSANSSNTIATISKEQQYTIAISVASGCITVDTILLKVFVANDLLVPNIFSPNNDGQNDKLFVNLVGIKTLQYFRVFNRYGKKLFETTNLGEGWDGKLNGVPQPVDTYIWTAMGMTKEGAPIYREGTITLVR
ncbi:MAG: hypothetical protein JWQ20_4452, partial [Conexibacter sp.]|nr:hypothetical protein [Conexibacter sp.]